MTDRRFHEIIDIAKNIIAEHKLDCLKVSGLELCRKMQKPVHSYSDLIGGKENYPKLKGLSAATIYFEGTRTIFYDEEIPDPSHVIYHELAHLLLEHETDGPAEEEEANTLAQFLQHPELLPKERKKQWPKLLSGAAAIIILCSTVFYGGVQVAKSLYPPQDPVQHIAIPAPKNLEQDETVFVTKSGSKYHKSDCYVIQDKETTGLDIADAIAQGYGSCKECFGP